MSYSVVLGISAVVALALPLVIARRRVTPGTVPFALLLVAAAEWAGAAALEHAASAPATKVFCAKLEYPGISAVAPLWLTFALAYTGRDAWLTRGRAAALWIVPALTVALAWTNEWHHLVWTSITPVGPAPGAALAYGHGVWFWMAAAYNHALLLAGTAAVLVALVRFRARYRRQTVALVVGLALPWIGNALYLGGWRVLEGRDPTPLAFTLTGLVYALGVFGFGLLDLVPLARHALIDSMADGVLVTDARDRVIDVNPAARGVLGLGTDPEIGTPVERVLAPWPEALARYRHAPEAEAELRVDAAGGARYVTLRVSPVRDAGGRARARVLVFSDVTARRRTEEALRQNEKLASLAQLLAGVSHELNNPLSVIVGHASLLRRHVAEGPVAARVEKIATAAERCARIVRNFLAVARQQETERMAIDLNRVLNDAVDFLAYPMQVDDVRLVLELAPDLPPLWADAQQIHQVAVNILANAHHAVRAVEGPRRVTLASWAAADGRSVGFRVSDNGPGIPEALRPRIFEPFFTTKAVGDGSGLGLSVCRGLVEAHDGRIEAESRPGDGATFTVTLPVADESAPAVVRPDPARPAARGRRILVVDDEPMVAEILGEILTGHGHYVDTAGDGRAALEKLAAGRFDLVLTDIKMPVLDGPGLYRQLVARDPGARRRVIFVSGDTLSDETRDFLAGTGAPLLHKPFDAESVRRAVDAALGAAG
jgi:two-component system NtrC family sensor kinase